MIPDPEFRELPTPQPLELDAVMEAQPSALERLLVRWRLLAGLAGLGLVIAIVSGVLIWRSGGFGSTELKLESPPSLQELTQLYPELADLLTDPTLSSVYKEFLVALESGGVEAAQDLAAQRGLLNDRDEIRITLVVDDAERVPSLVQELQTVGVTVEGSYKERINVGVPLALIQQLAADQGTEALFERLTQMEHIIRLELPAPRGSDAVRGDAMQGEGVSITGAEEWHTAGFTGQSIRVGVLDLGFDGYRSLLGTELPESVVSESFVYGKGADELGEVHGTACAEIVHEMAPGAELYFAAYDGTLVSMGQAVEWLLSQDVYIISNSTTGVVGPMDGSDEAAAMVDEAVSSGILWVNSAGNAAEEHYRGLFTDADGDGLHEFPDGTEAIGLYQYSPNLTAALNWDDWQAVTEDYDLFLYDDQGDLLASAEDVQSGLPGQGAAELLIGRDVPEGVYFLSIKAHSTTRPGTLDLYTLGAELEFPVADHSLGSPADARGALAVGATEYRDDSLAVYSSQGPSNDGRLKPDLSAPAGVSSVTYAPDVFNGTSASTPHVAGAAALVWSAFPEYSAGQVREYLQTHALDLGSSGPDNGYGHGRLRLSSPPPEIAERSPTPTLEPTLPPTEAPEPTRPATEVPEATLPATEVPEATLLPTEAPEPTVVALVPEPAEKPLETGTSSGVSPLLLGALGLFGGVVALGGGGLLLVALRRSSRRSSRVAAPRPQTAMGSWGTTLDSSASTPLPPHLSETVPGYGVLVGGGLAPTVVRPGLTSMGRSAQNDIVIDSVLVSRRHARLECAREQCTVEDLGSANGVFVNGRRVSRAALSPGDRLRLGDVELLYHGAGAVQAQAWLEIGTSRHPLSGEHTSIGRSRENDVHLADERASRRHARIDLQQGVFVIVDLDSVNGTFVNGQRVTRQALRDGDEIRIGETHMRFRA